MQRIKNKIKRLIYREDSKFLYQLNRSIQMNNYPFTEDYSKEGSIIVSLTTHSTRIRYIHYVLDSLYYQTLRPDHVYLFLSEHEYQVLPNILSKFQPWLQIFYTKDIGSFKKFIPALLKANDNQIVISLDDDFLYPSWLLQDLYNLYKQHKDKRALFVFNGIDWQENKIGFGIGGGLGVLWNTKIFNKKDLPSFFDEDAFLTKYKNKDDTWISKYCCTHGIRIISLCNKNYNTTPLPQDFIELPSARYLPISYRR